MVTNDGVHPFLRWAGGKQKLIKYLINYIPESERYDHYYEPFFGGGSLFFKIKPKNATISDINNDLINCYQQIAKKPKTVYKKICEHSYNNSAEYFYHIRSMPLDNLSKIDMAARFIYLNKAAFNGIYRVNKLGYFNVPYGPSENGPALPSEELLVSVAKCLKNKKILSGDFEKVLINAKQGDFVYLDPPYPPLSKTACFTHYSIDRFDWNEQIRVARMFSDLSERGCLVMLTNSYQNEVVSLYKKFYRFKIDAIRCLGANGDRFKVKEIVITNYKV